METTESRNNLFPIFLKLSELNILIVGAGNVGLEKLHFLLKSSPDANVTVVANSFLPELKALAEDFSVKMIEDSFHEKYLENVDVIIAATDNRNTNITIRTLAKARKILVNVADTPDLCDFYLGGIVTKGDLKIAISTNGKSPTFSKRFRQMLEATLPESIPQMLTNLRIIRSQIKGDFGQKVKQLNDLTSVLIDQK